DDASTIQTKVAEQVQTLDAALQDTIPALLALLDALPADSPFLRLDALQRRQHTLTALKRLLLRQSQTLPLLLVCEDLHWLDAETQALLDSFIESLPTARCGRACGAGARTCVARSKAARSMVWTPASPVAGTGGT